MLTDIAETAKYFEYAAAGGIAGCMADSAMHGCVYIKWKSIFNWDRLDTIKTRMVSYHRTSILISFQQGQLNFKSAKPYKGIGQSFSLILRQEGMRGLYGGYVSAAIGSFLSTSVHFGVYELIKNRMIENGHNEFASFFVAGALGDVFASVAYVPSEVGCCHCLYRLIWKGPENTAAIARKIQ